MTNYYSLVFIIILFILLITHIITLKNFNAMKQKFIKSNIDNIVMQEYIEFINSQEKNIDSNEMASKEDFIKFLSDSREWAFTYIEDVQNGLEKFVNDVDDHISYFDKYGNVLSTERPDYVAMEQISKSYKELKKLLPLEQNEK